MDTTKTSLETSPMTYQCIVCQMTTVSMSLLHRHQTYRHTPEELSLSTIGLQCSLINNVNATNSIVYDNSWLCDPTKQAEFYTVSASLLNDCNNNNNNSNVVPVDYVVKKQRLLKKERENANQQEMRDFDYKIDCNLDKTGKLGPKICENFVEYQPQAIGKELDFTKKSLEEIKHTVKSSSFNMETNCFSKQSKEFLFIGKEADHDSSGVKEIVKSVAIDTEINSGAKYPEEARQDLKSKDLKFRHIKEFTFIDKKVDQTEGCFEGVKQAVKSVTIDTETNFDSKYPEEYQVIGREVIFTRKSPDEVKQAVNTSAMNTEANFFPKQSGEFQAFGRKLEFTEKSPEEAKQAVQSKELKFVGKEVDQTEKSSEEVKQAVKSVTINTEANFGSKYPEEYQVIGREVIFTRKSPEEVQQAVNTSAMDTEAIFFPKQSEEFQAFSRKLEFTEKSLEEAKQAVKSRVNEGNVAMKSIAIDPEANSVTKYPEEFQVIGREVIFTTKSSEHVISNSPEKEAKESNVIVKEVNSVSQIPEKETEELKIISTKNFSPKSSESGIEAKESKLIDDFNAKRKEKIIKAKKSQVIGMDLDSFDNCIEGLCNDLKNLKNKPQKRKRTPAINSAAKKVKTTRKPRVSRKKAKTCHTLSGLDAKKAHQETEIYEKKMSSSINSVERNFENEKSEISVKQSIAYDDFAHRLQISGSKSNIREIEISPYDCTITNCLQRNLKTEIIDNLPSENFIQNHLETYDTEVLVEENFTDANPIEIKSVIDETDISNFVNEENHENTENIGSTNLPNEFTFPWYPPDINDYSILVLDPEAHQLVWTSVAIVGEQEELERDATQETPFLPELTEADLLGSEISNNTTVSSVSRAKENHNTTCLQSTSNESTTKKNTKPHTNFVLCPRKGAAKKSTGDNNK